MDDDYEPEDEDDLESNESEPNDSDYASDDDGDDPANGGMLMMNWSGEIMTNMNIISHNMNSHDSGPKNDMNDSGVKQEEEASIQDDHGLRTPQGEITGVEASDQDEDYYDEAQEDDLETPGGAEANKEDDLETPGVAEDSIEATESPAVEYNVWVS